MCDSMGGELVWVFGEAEIGDVDAWYYFGGSPVVYARGVG